MRHGHAVTETGRPEPLAREQIVRHGGAGNAAVVFENQAGLLESTFFTGHFQVQQDVFEREDFAQVRWILPGAEVAAPRVDIEPATARVARVHGQLLRRALAQDVDKDAFHALLVEFVVFAETDQILEQAFLVDLRTAVVDLHAGPVGLARDQAVRFEQVRHQLFLHRLLVQCGFQQFRRRVVGVDVDVEAVQQQAVQLAHGQLAELLGLREHDVHAGACRLRQILQQQRVQRIDAVETGLVERVQVQLERFRFDDVGRVGRHGDAGNRHLRLAAAVKPRDFVGIPDIDAKERQGAGQPQFVALALARNREQQFRRVIGAVGGDRVGRLVPVAIPERGQELPELVHLAGRHLQADQDAAHVAALAAVVAQRDIPVRRHAVQEAHQRARALGEFEAVQQLAVGQRALAAHQVAHVGLGQLVVGQVQCAEIVGLEGARQRARFAAVGDLHADEHMGFVLVADAVVELGDVARSHQRAKALEAAALLGQRDGKQRFARLAQFRAFGNETQAVEIHVGAAGNRDQGLVPDRVFGQCCPFDIGLGARNGQRAGRLQDAAGVREHVLDGGADGVGIDNDDVIDILLGEAEGFLAHQAHGRAVRKQADVRQRDAFAGLDAAGHGVRIHGLHADDLDVRADRLDVAGNAGNQPAAADGDKNCVDRPRVLAQDFHADRALAGNYVRIVERVDKGQLLFFFQRQRVVVGVGVRLAVQHDLDGRTAARLDGVDFHLRRGGGHHDQGAAPQLGCRQRHALGVVAGRGANHATLALRFAQVGHLVVGATNLEAEHALHVFALEINAVVKALRQRRRQFQREERAQGRWCHRWQPIRPTASADRQGGRTGVNGFRHRSRSSVFDANYPAGTREAVARIAAGGQGSGCSIVRAGSGADVGIHHQFYLGHAAAAGLGTSRVCSHQGQSQPVLERDRRGHRRQHAGRRRRLLDGLPGQADLRQGAQEPLVPLARALRRQDHAAGLAARHRRSAVHAGRLAQAAFLAQPGLHGGGQAAAVSDHDHAAVVCAGRRMAPDRAVAGLIWCIRSYCSNGWNLN
uniref:Uncharacterized protein n=1 Tax=Tanacetum cinerariifolium TaxID=118510 RepID=A0A699GK81_TANCI|nr:hypothetical protein [Tanacetum cinerariifolium]